MKAKRFFSVLLVVMMLVSCFAISASAAEPTGTLNIHLYQTDDDGNIKLSDTDLSGTTADYSGTPVGVPNVTFTIERVANDATSASAPALTGSDAHSTTAKTNSDGLATATLPYGRYKVTVKASDKPSYVAQPVAFLVDIPTTNVDGTGFNDTVDVYPKTVVTPEKPSVDKQVAAVASDGTVGSYGDSANLSKDQYASWKITVDVPEGIENYSKFVVTDVLSSKLTYKTGSLVISGGSLKSTSATDFDASGKLVLNFDISSLSADKDIVITFQTQIKNNEAGVDIPNHVTLTYNDNPANVLVDNPYYDNSKPEDPTDNPKKVPNDPTDPKFDDKTNNWTKPEKYDDGVNDPDGNNPEGDTPGENYDPWVWTGKLEVEKVDALNNNTKLEGVVFRISSDDPTLRDALKANAAVTVSDDVCMITTGDGGTYTIPGLLDGDYTLTEIKAKDKYELNPKDINLKVENGRVTITNATDVSSFATKDGDFKVVVKNIPSTDLPLTGGMGVGMFAVLGLALAAFGGVYLFKSRKADASC